MTRLSDAYDELNRRVHSLYLETEIILHDEPDDVFIEHLDIVVSEDPRSNRLLRQINRLEIAYPEEAA